MRKIKLLAISCLLTSTFSSTSFASTETIPSEAEQNREICAFIMASDSIWDSISEFHQLNYQNTVKDLVFKGYSFDEIGEYSVKVQKDFNTLSLQTKLEWAYFCGYQPTK